MVAMQRRQLWAVGPAGELAVHADLSAHTSTPLNDAIVGPGGTVYVGTFGFDLFGGGAYEEGLLLAADPDGGTRVVADRLAFPNGMGILADGVTLLVAESAAARISAFTIADDGGLRDRRIWAELPTGYRPDGMCLDAEGLAWVAVPDRRRCVLIAPGERIVDELELADRRPISCVLGGADGRSLYVASASTLQRELAVQRRDSRVDRAVVSVPARHGGVGS